MVQSVSIIIHFNEVGYFLVPLSVKSIPMINFRRIKYKTQLYLFLLPYLLGIIILVLLPAVISFGMAFFRYDGVSAPVWVGTLNFVLAFHDELFGLSIQNSVALVLLPVPLRVFGAFLVARLLQKNGRFLNTFRAIIFLPSIIPNAAYALAWIWIFNPLSGPLNLFLQTIGLYTPAWLVDPLWAKPALVLLSLWQIGEGFLVSLAALTDMPPTLDEAAQLDGASAWQQFWFVQLPILAPILLILIFRDIALTLQTNFDTIFIMTQGGPYYATYTLPQFIYEQGFDLLLFGSASAALWVLYAVTGLIVLVVYLLARQWRVGPSEALYVL